MLIKAVIPILFNFTVGFIIPWMIVIIICRRNPLLFLTAAPFISLLSITFNQIGMQTGFWTLHPETEYLIFNSINIDFGFNPAFGVLFTYLIYFKQWKRWLIYLGFLLFLTGSEELALLFNKVRYGDDWNLLYTFLTYLLGLILLDVYFHSLKKLAQKL